MDGERLSLREWRYRRGWTQHELAARAGLTQKSVSALEVGAVSARPGTIRKLAAALGIDPAQIALAPPPPRRRGQAPPPDDSEKRGGLAA